MNSKWSFYALLSFFILTSCTDDEPLIDIPRDIDTVNIIGNHGSTDFWIVKTDTAANIEWQRCYGGRQYEENPSIHTTSDGGYIVAGSSSSTDGDVSGNHGDSDYWVLKLDETGNIQWEKCYGGSSEDRANSIIQTVDGGYVIAGYSNSDDGDVSGNYGGRDCWVLKLDAEGNIEWEKNYGGTESDYSESIQQTHDGGYIFAGYTFSNDRDVSELRGYGDAWIAKLDDTGTIQWKQCIGGSTLDYAYSIVQTIEGDYVFSGFTQSHDHDVEENPYQDSFWIVKLNETGQIIWQQYLPGSFIGTISLQSTIEEGFIAAGLTWHEPSEFSCGLEGANYAVVKLNKHGDVQWSRCFGGSTTEWANAVLQNNNNEFIVAGGSLSNDGDVNGNHGSYDYWIIGLNNDGDLQWQKCLGGSHTELATSLQLTNDGGYIIAGETESNDGDVAAPTTE